MSAWGAAARTIAKDDHAWDLWVDFSACYGLDPLIMPDFAASRPDLVVARLSLFVLWVYPRLKGRGQSDAKPRSAHAYATAIVRIFSRDHGTPMPRIKLIEGAVRGLLQNYKEAYGVHALARARTPAQANYAATHVATR
jgi:hypothetical protein